MRDYRTKIAMAVLGRAVQPVGACTVDHAVAPVIILTILRLDVQEISALWSVFQVKLKIQICKIDAVFLRPCFLHYLIH